MNGKRISLIIGFKDLFDEIPQSALFYLSEISREDLIDYAIKLLTYTTKPSIYNENNTLWAFLTEKERGLIHSLYEKLVYKRNKIGVNTIILNVRASFRFFEYVYSITDTTSSLSDSEKNINVLKAYLCINDEISNVELEEKENAEFHELVISHALKHERYNNENLLYLRLVQLIKSCYFLEFCEANLPDHINEFIGYYNISHWKIYILYLHQIGMLVNSPDLHTPYISISIPNEDSNYESKSIFLNKFCLAKVSLEQDQDYSILKNTPVLKIEDEYRIIFEQFFIEKIFQSLYFKFNEINTSLKKINPTCYEKNFRRYITTEFSEKYITNIILYKVFAGKYIHLGRNLLREQGDTDYYVRNGKYIFLFECKDNFIGKDILEECDTTRFIDKLKELFIESNNKKDKAINQIINNIEKVLNKSFLDKEYKSENCVIYPSIIVHNSIFSLSGINEIVNNWFVQELQTRKIACKNIKPLTIIDIDTLVLYQGIFAQKKYSLKNTIDKFWLYYNKKNTKKCQTEVEAIEQLISARNSFKIFCNKEFDKLNVFTKEIRAYNKYFE